MTELEEDCARMAQEMLEGGAQYRRFYYAYGNKGSYHNASVYARELMFAIYNIGRKPHVKITDEFYEVWI